MQILVLSDLHVGSPYGLLPPDFTSGKGNKIRQNIGQRWLWECWEEMRDLVSSLDISAVVLNGDLIEGPHGELCLGELSDQVDACARILNTLPQGCAWYFVQGSEFHDTEAGREVETLARLFRALYRGTGGAHHSHEVLNLKVGDVTINFAHGIGISSGLYRAVAIDREALWSALAGKEGKLPKADVIVRSHAHYFVHVEHASKHAVVTPGWQLQTRFMRRRSVYRMVPDVGAVLIEIQEDNRWQDPVVVRKILFKLPPAPVERL